MNAGNALQVAILLYPGVTGLDAVGPWEVLSRIPGAEVRFVGKEAARWSSKAALCFRVVRTTRGLVHIGARRAYCNDCRLHGTGQLPWTGNTSDRSHRYRENVVAAARPRPVHSWDTDMDPGIDLALARQRLLDAADERCSTARGCTECP